jgi:hypothetical protein
MIAIVLGEQNRLIVLRAVENMQHRHGVGLDSVANEIIFVRATAYPAVFMPRH